MRKATLGDLTILPSIPTPVPERAAEAMRDTADLQCPKELCKGHRRQRTANGGTGEHEMGTWSQAPARAHQPVWLDAPARGMRQARVVASRRGSGARAGAAPVAGSPALRGAGLRRACGADPLVQLADPTLDVGAPPPAPACLPRERIVWIPHHRVDFRATEADDSRHLRDGQQEAGSKRHRRVPSSGPSRCVRVRTMPRLSTRITGDNSGIGTPRAAIRRAPRNMGPTRADSANWGETAWGESRPVRAAASECGRGSELQGHRSCSACGSRPRPSPAPVAPACPSPGECPSPPWLATPHTDRNRGPGPATTPGTRAGAPACSVASATTGTNPGPVSGALRYRRRHRDGKLVGTPWRGASSGTVSPERELPATPRRLCASLQRRCATSTPRDCAPAFYAVSLIRDRAPFTGGHHRGALPNRARSRSLRPARDDGLSPDAYGSPSHEALASGASGAGARPRNTRRRVASCAGTTRTAQSPGAPRRWAGSGPKSTGGGARASVGVAGAGAGHWERLTRLLITCPLRGARVVLAALR